MSTREIVVQKYTETDSKLYMSLDEAFELSCELSTRIREYLAKNGLSENVAVVGIANGGLMVAGAASVTTGVITLKSLEDDLEKVKKYEPILFINKRIQHYPWSQNNTEYKSFIAWLQQNGVEPWNQTNINFQIHCFF